VGWKLWLPVALALVSGAAGCGGAAQVKLSEDSHQVARPAGIGEHQTARSPVGCLTGSRAISSAALGYAALVPHVAVVYDRRGGAGVIARLGRLDENGQPTVLGVTGIDTGERCKPDWYRVQTSTIPNGTTGWVRASAVRPYRVASRIVINLSQRRLRLYRRGKLVLETAVGVGAPQTPTPVGRYFVNERYLLTSADGPFGPAALGISAHSDVLQQTWVQNGPIGVHGTNEPWSIGQASSHGCVRLGNEVMRRLFPLAPAGTPVLIEA
jgi:lipoprotein-anchoring transpeptidase ErfK/SrfK